MSDIDREQWLNDMAYSAWVLGSTGDGVGCLNAGIRAVYQRGHEDGAAELTRLRSQLAAAESRAAEAVERLNAAERELERWRHGVTVEGDFVCPDSLRLSEAVEVLRRQEWLALGCGVARCPECGAVSDLENGQWQGDHHDDCALAACLRGDRAQGGGG